MIFAEIDAAGWSVIIGAIFLGLGQIVTLILGHLRLKDIEKAAEKANLEAAKEAKEVRTEVKEVKTTVDEVKQQTDGMKDQLVAEVRKASFARGVKSETDKELKQDAVVAVIKQEIAAVPEKTAEKVVEKLDEKKESMS